MDPIKLTDEARSATRRKPISDKRLLEMLLSNDADDNAGDEESQWLAARELKRRGHEFENLPRMETIS